MLPIETIPNANKFSNTPKPSFQYRPPKDYAWPDDGFDRLAFECQLGNTPNTPYVRDFASEGCFFDFEQGADHVE